MVNSLDSARGFISSDQRMASPYFLIVSFSLLSRMPWNLYFCFVSFFFFSFPRCEASFSQTATGVEHTTLACVLAQRLPPLPNPVAPTVPRTDVGHRGGKQQRAPRKPRNVCCLSADTTEQRRVTYILPKGTQNSGDLLTLPNMLRFVLVALFEMAKVRRKRRKKQTNKQTNKQNFGRGGGRGFKHTEMQGSFQIRTTFPFCPAFPADATNVSRPAQKNIYIRKKSERPDCRDTESEVS